MPVATASRTPPTALPSARPASPSCSRGRAARLRPATGASAAAAEEVDKEEEAAAAADKAEAECGHFIGAASENADEKVDVDPKPLPRARFGRLAAKSMSTPSLFVRYHTEK
jgi:hypothetical protein